MKFFLTQKYLKKTRKGEKYEKNKKMRDDTQKKE